MALVAESIPMPRVRVRRFRACKRKRALWKKSRVDRRVGGDPVNGVDHDGRFITFGINSGGFSIGVNATPIGIPLGGGYNVGWSGGGYLGAYAEAGPRVGCFSATSQVGHNYYRDDGNVTYVSAGVQYGPGGIGVSNSYSWRTGEWSGTTLNGSVGVPGTSFGVGASYNFKTGDLNGTLGYYGSSGNWDYNGGISIGDNGFSWNAGGQFVRRDVHPSGLRQAGIDDAIEKQNAETDPNIEYVLFEDQNYAVKVEKNPDEVGFGISIPERVETVAHTHGAGHSDQPSNLDGISAADPALAGKRFAVINGKTKEVQLYDGRNNWYGPNATAAKQDPGYVYRTLPAKPTNFQYSKIWLGY